MFCDPGSSVSSLFGLLCEPLEVENDLNWLQNGPFPLIKVHGLCFRPTFDDFGTCEVCLSKRAIGSSCFDTVLVTQNDSTAKDDARFVSEV